MNQMYLFDGQEATPMDGDTKYSRAIKIPQYVPKNTAPDIIHLTDTEKYNTLMAEINKSNLPDDEKAFLRMAATRHIAFNYSLIADYYAHATPEMQRLMEKSALVILDVDDAIANGYITLSKKMMFLIQEQKKQDGRM